MLTLNTILQGRYLIMQHIGHGGMGAVYLAKDQRLGSLVALKETFFSDERLLKAFEREARLLASLRHPALPRVSDHFAEGDGQFLVMEYIAGDDLEQMLDARSAAFAPGDVLTWADQLLDALDYLHTQQPPIVHRDIKPQNLKLTSRGQIILLDFGLAKGSASDMTRATGSTSILGYTPGYAPLEQIQGDGTDSRADLYSLAATFYRLMTRSSPPDALRRATAVLNGDRDPLEPANKINPHVSERVAAVLQQAMALKRDERPPTAGAMRRALAEAGRGSTEAVLATRTMASASNAATVIGSPGSPTLSASDRGSQAPSSDRATQLASPANAPDTLVSSQGATALDPPKRRRTMWAVVAIITVLGGGALSWMLINNRGKALGENANTNTAPDAAKTNANQTTANLNRRIANAIQAFANANHTAPNVNRATANVNHAAANRASDESRPRDDMRGRNGGKKKGKPGVGGTMKKRLRRFVPQRRGY